MDKKLKINTAIFFSTLYWVLVWILVIKRHLILPKITLLSIILLIAVDGIILLLTRFLCPAFQFILKITHKLGKIIFALISIIVFIFILNPIALLRKLFKKTSVAVKYDHQVDTYFDQWQPSDKLEKQF